MSCESCNKGDNSSLKGSPLDDADLVDKAWRGNVRAYGELVLLYQDLAFRTAYLIVRDAAEAEDVTQEAFMKGYRTLDRFQHGRPFRPWLLKIVVNEARNRRIASGRRGRLQARVSACPPDNIVAPSAEAAVMDATRRENLLQMVNSLSTMDRLVIACRYFLELSEEETATVLNCRRGTVKSRLSRALARLRQALVATDADFLESDMEVAGE